MKELTVVIPFLNEGDELIRTIESIYATAPSELFSVIAIDDASSIRTERLEKFDDVTHIRNETRIGAGASITKGAYLAETPFIVIFDAHMRFRQDHWCERLIAALKREPRTAFCTACVGLDKGNPEANVENAKGGIYYGATIALYDHKDGPENYRNIIEAKWLNSKSLPSLTDDFEIPCILGANYGVSKEWFKRIRGFEGLLMWGSCEPFISLKSWLAGGKCKIIPSIGIGHYFRPIAPYITHSYYLLYNKMFVAKTLFPELLATDLVAFLGYNNDVAVAKKKIEADEKKIREYREYYESIFEKSIDDICDRFSIEHSWPSNIQRN